MIDALIKWAIIAALCAAAMATIYKAWDHYVGEPYREEGRQSRQAEVDALDNQVKIAKVANLAITRDLKDLQDTVSRYAAEALAWQDKARLAKEAAARDAKLFEIEKKRLTDIINRTPSKESCESICARANALLGELVTASVF